MEYYFWMATIQHYFWLAMAITVNPQYIIFSALMFFAIPSTTKAELFPGMRDSLNTQLEILKTQMYLNQKQYYENLQ